MTGLNAPVDVRWDEWGMPHIQAQNDAAQAAADAALEEAQPFGTSEKTEATPAVAAKKAAAPKPTPAEASATGAAQGEVK